MRVIKKDSTDQSIVIRIIDSGDGTPETAVEHNTAGIDLWYRREAATKTDITEAALAALDSAHSDGGIEHIGNGYYRLDLPDAAVATGCNGVMVGGTVTGMIVVGTYISLVDYDPTDAVRLGLTALPNAAADAAGGLPVSDAGGLDIDTKLANTHEVTAARMGALTDWINAGRLDLILDIIAADVVNVDGSSIPTAANVADAVWNEASTGHTDAGKAGQQLWTDIDAVLTDTNELQVNQGNWATATGFNTVIPDVAGTAAGLHGTTDGKIDTVDGVVDTILVDTNELQTNQGNWLTATGFSTHNAAAVWAVGTRTLTSFGTLVTDIWHHLLASITTANSIGKLIKDYLDAAISGRSSHTAANVDTTLSGTHGAGSWEGGGAAPTVGEIRTEMDNSSTQFSAIVADTNEIQGKLPTNKIMGSSVASDKDDEIDSIKTTVEALNNLSAANVKTQAASALTEYDPPTRAEATADKDEVIVQVNANETKIDIIDTNVDDIETICTLVNKWLNNKMVVSGTSLILYADDGVTPLKTWTLSEGALTVDAPYNRSASV